MNNIYPYALFKAANVRGTEEVLRLASQITIKPVHFISTASVFVSDEYFKLEVVLENDPLEHSQGLVGGYPQSKWVAEKIVMMARDRGLPCSIYRLGRITWHSQTGVWNSNDLFYRFIKSCIQLKSVPEMNTMVEITPVDYLAKVLIHLSRQPESLGKAFHLMNSDSAHWSQFINCIRSLGYPLQQSVKRYGILQALLIRPLNDEKYELVSGERRYRAAQECGLSEVPVMIREMSDEQAVQYALTENLQREDLNPVEEVEGILQLLSLRLKTDREEIISLLNKIAKVKRGLADNVVRPEEQQIIEEVFVSVGRLSPESFRTHRLPILNLPEEILQALRAGRIEYTKAKEIAKLESEEDRLELLEASIELSFRLGIY